jgi:hypothetical protein
LFKKIKGKSTLEGLKGKLMKKIMSKKMKMNKQEYTLP